MGISFVIYEVWCFIRDFVEVIYKWWVGKVVFVNFIKLVKSWDNVIDYWVKWDCDVWVGDLMECQLVFDFFIVIFGVFLYFLLLENVQYFLCGGVGMLVDDVILILSDDEFDDDFDEG